MKTMHFTALVVSAALLFHSCSSNPQAPAANDNSPAPVVAANSQGQAAVADDISEKNILQIAQGSPDHTTLAAGISAAGLEHVLANNGPFTVFAPNNDAFAKLPSGTLDELLKPENKEKLAFIIKHHASPGEYKGALLKDGMSLYQATGQYIKVENKDGKVTVNGANVLATVEAANGVVHVVDQVLLPAE